MFHMQKIGKSLESHQIFQLLDHESDSSGKHKASQLLHMEGCSVYVWSNDNSCLYTTNLQADNAADGKSNIQALLCNDAPMFKVLRVVFNQDCTHVALIGSRGVCVMFLPQRWGKNAEYEGGKEKITCRVATVADRFFTTNISVQLLQASWYPTEMCHTPYLCVLSSDNTLRLYNINGDVQTAVQTHRLRPSNDMQNMSIGGSHLSLLSMYSVTAGIGETAVAFDFGPVFEYSDKKISAFKKNDTSPIPLQPVYILQGNGDVLLLITSITNNKYSKGKLFGPLIMLPSAEDNYGTDSCSISVLNTSPTVVVIGSMGGKLYHCIALWMLASEDDDDDVGSVALDHLETQSIVSKSTFTMKESSGEITPPTLYVYETVELELIPTLNHDDDDDANLAEQYFISIHKDFTMPLRYHCCSPIGIHSIMVTWLHKLALYISDEDNGGLCNLADLAEVESCTAEHVICTKPTTTATPCLIKGVTIANPGTGTALVCLTDDNHCTVLPLLSAIKTPQIPLLASMKNQEGSSGLLASPMKKITEQDFEIHIRSLLKRETSQPVIKSSCFDNVSEKESIQLLTQATSTLRNQYILKQKLASDAISKRVRLLNEQKQQQLEDLQALEQNRCILTEKAENIANAYEDYKETQERILLRLNDLASSMKHGNQILSKAEEDMSKELRSVEERLPRLNNKIKQVKIKKDYQQKKMDSVADGTTSSVHNKLLGGGDSVSQMTGPAAQIEVMKNMLLEKGDKIHELIKKLNNMNAQVGL